MSDDSSGHGAVDWITRKLNVFQVIQLYLINDIYENHEGIYSILYNIVNDIKLPINLKELNQNLNGYVSFHQPFLGCGKNRQSQGVTNKKHVCKNRQSQDLRTF